MTLGSSLNGRYIVVILRGHQITNLDHTFFLFECLLFVLISDLIILSRSFYQALKAAIFD